MQLISSDTLQFDFTPASQFVLDADVVCKTNRELRNKTKDRLCKYEDELVEKHKACMWLFKNIDEEMKCNFELNIEDVQFQYQTTLPYSEKISDIRKLVDIWKLYNKRAYYRDTITNPEYRNLPTGYLNAKVVFVGEAPGWGGEPKDYGSRVYTFGRNSMLFRILSMKVFGPCWYTNIFKAAIPNNTKRTGESLQAAIDALMQELCIIKPEAIICLGWFSYEMMMQYGNWNRLFRIHHPSYVLRKGNDELFYKENMLDVKKQIQNRKETIWTSSSLTTQT